jgi:hypothetical protein
MKFGGFALCPPEGSDSYILLVISAHFFGLSTKFGHSIPWPLDLDGLSVKQPLEKKVGLILFLRAKIIILPSYERVQEI